MSDRTRRIVLTYLAFVTLPVVVLTVYGGALELPTAVSVGLAIAGVFAAAAFLLPRKRAGHHNVRTVGANARIAAPTLAMSAALVAPPAYQPYLLLLAIALGGWAWKSDGRSDS